MEMNLNDFEYSKLSVPLANIEPLILPLVNTQYYLV